jgi:hypothetical protein
VPQLMHKDEQVEEQQNLQNHKDSFYNMHISKIRRIHTMSVEYTRPRQTSNKVTTANRRPNLTLLASQNG